MADDVKTKILNALESPKYKWRTLDGVATETKLSKSTVLDTIEDLSHKGLIVRSSVPSVSGEILLTTRKHYRETASFRDRLLAVLKNRGA